jgi:lysophospholipase L1-like esterase
VLDDAEQLLVANATAAYNTSLLNAANAKGLAFFDANSYFRNIAAAGVATNGVNNTADFIRGNIFSLDGVHPTPRGYALVANEIIRTINSKYGSTLAPVDPNTYRGVLLP